MAWQRGGYNKNQGSGQGGGGARQGGGNARGGGGNFRQRNSGGGQPRGNNGGNRGRGRQQQQQQDDNFQPITGMFPSQSGNSHTIFLKADHLGILKNLQEDDLLGISPARDSDRMNLWVKYAEGNGPQQGEDQGGGDEQQQGQQ